MKIPLDTSSKISIRTRSNKTNNFDPVNFRIVELDLSCNHLLNFDPTLFQNHLNNIENLNLMKNNLISIDKRMFARLLKLTHVNLSSNKLNKIHPNTFGHLKHLTRLDLSLNKLDELQASVFDGMLNLFELDLSSNLFESFEKNTFKCLINLNKYISIILRLFYSEDCVFVP